MWCYGTTKGNPSMHTYVVELVKQVEFLKFGFRFNFFYIFSGELVAWDLIVKSLRLLVVYKLLHWREFASCTLKKYRLSDFLSIIYIYIYSLYTLLPLPPFWLTCTTATTIWGKIECENENRLFSPFQFSMYTIFHVHLISSQLVHEILLCFILCFL